MKKKGLTIGLALVVISIWGAVLSKAMKPRASDGLSAMDTSLRPRQVNSLTDTLPAGTSLGNYRDPFLGEAAPAPRAIMNDRPSSSAPAARKAPPTSAAPAFTWPPIAFKGMLRNTNSGQGVALVAINGKDRVLVAGKEEENGIMLLSVARDSVTLKAHGEQRRFGR